MYTYKPIFTISTSYKNMLGILLIYDPILMLLGFEDKKIFDKFGLN